MRGPRKHARITHRHRSNQHIVHATNDSNAFIVHSGFLFKKLFTANDDDFEKHVKASLFILLNQILNTTISN